MGVVLLLLAAVAPVALALGFLGAFALRSKNPLLFWPGFAYVGMVRGVPDIIFFLFVPIAIDQAVEFLFHHVRCPDWTEPIWRGADFVVCAQAKIPPAGAPAWVHDLWAFMLAVIAFAIVFGAFTANTLAGAMAAIPKAQIETAEAFGMSQLQIFRRVMLPQLWVYALPGLSNIWMILTKATPLLFLLGIRDVVYWARELGGAKTHLFAYPHPDWRIWYFLVLLCFYLALTAVSQKVFDRLIERARRGLDLGETNAEGRVRA